MKEITAFGCDYCAMTSRRKGSVKRHEVYNCRKNPSRSRCGNCKHMEHEYGSSESEGAGLIYYAEPETWYCTELDQDISSNGLNQNNGCQHHEPVEV